MQIWRAVAKSIRKQGYVKLHTYILYYNIFLGYAIRIYHTSFTYDSNEITERPKDPPYTGSSAIICVSTCSFQRWKYDWYYTNKLSQKYHKSTQKFPQGWTLPYYYKPKINEQRDFGMIIIKTMSFVYFLENKINPGVALSCEKSKSKNLPGNKLRRNCKICEYSYQIRWSPGAIRRIINQNGRQTLRKSHQYEIFEREILFPGSDWFISKYT